MTYLLDAFHRIIAPTSGHARRELNTYDVLKVLAIALMVIDHAGAYVLHDVTWLRAIGRSAMPLFLFLVGYSGNFRFSPRLLFYALLMSLATYGFFSSFVPLNILWNILFARMFLGWCESKKWFHNSFGIVAPLLILSLLTSPLVDYGTYAWLYALAGYYHRTRKNDPEHPFWLLPSAFLINGYAQLTVFHFTPYQYAVAVAGLAGVFLATYRFDVKTLRSNVFGGGILKWVSAHAIEVYCLHILLLIWLYILLRHL